MVIERVKAVAAQQFDVDEDEMTGETSFTELGADQFDITEFLKALSDDFEFEIPEYLADRIETLGDVVDYIKKQIA